MGPPKAPPPVDALKLFTHTATIALLSDAQHFVQFVWGGFTLPELFPLVFRSSELSVVALKRRQGKTRVENKTGDSDAARPILVGRADLKLPGLLPNAFFTDGGVAGPQ